VEDYLKKKIMDELLSREDFKRLVFERTKGKCCVPGCNCDAVDAHHIMDRKLWSDGGYYISNGAALCSEHHLDAEQGRITPYQCITYMRIDVHTVRVPDSLKERYASTDCADDYTLALTSGLLDKWGKVVDKQPNTGYDPDWYKKFKKK
jgi:hypothetical protein